MSRHHMTPASRSRILKIMLRLDEILSRNTTDKVRGVALDVRTACERLLSDPESDELWDDLEEYVNEGLEIFPR